MILIVMLAILGIASIALSTLARVKVEETVPVIVLSIIAILYPFYCLNMLATGECVVYACLLLLMIVFVHSLKNAGKSVVKELIEKVSPGICIFIGACGFYLLFLRDNRVELWDELRLWGAVPKALYKTHSLQLGEDSWIFPIMQSYPPAMPLLVYFFTARAPSFPEYQIFFVYALLASSLLLPIFKNLEWRQWPRLLPAAVILIWLPCVFSSHGGDYSWFYESLYIDPILGILIGFAFHLSIQEPFSSGFSQYRFFVSLLVLTLIKDSGAAFAAFAAVNALVLYYFKERKCGNRKYCIAPFFVSISPIILGYGLWKILLLIYGIHNHIGIHFELLSFSTIIALFESLLTAPMILINGGIFSTELQVTFIPCFAGFLYLSVWVNKKTQRIPNTYFVMTWLCMTISIVAFFVGYCLSFGEHLPSFSRYVSTILTAVMIFVGFQMDEIMSLEMPVNLKTIKRGKMFFVVAVAWVLLLVGFQRYFSNWEMNKVTMNDYEKEVTSFITYQIKQNSQNNRTAYSDYYLLVADKPRDNSRIHHRIYFNLIGTSARVRNFWSESNITGFDHPTCWTDNEILDTAEQWGKRLFEEEYEYVCVVLLDGYTTNVLQALGAKEPKMGDIYAIVQDNTGSVSLVKKG